MRVVLVQALKFGLVGLLNTGVGLSAIFLAISLLGLNPFRANIVGYAFGLSLSFVLNARWTFGGDINRSNLIRFLAAFFGSYALNVVVLIAATNCGVGPYHSQALAVGSYAIAFFLLSKTFVFSASTRQFHDRAR
jgi:putative flippase GtrA